MSESPRIGDEVSSSTTVEEDVDEARSEATFRFSVRDFSELKDSALSAPCFVRNLPWKIMVMPRVQSTTRSLGYFLQCNGESEAASWSCQASADLRIVKKIPPDSNEQTYFSRKISHLFYSKENDWGFSHFMAWNDVMDPEKGFYDSVNDSITLEVKVVADAPHGVSWDSKKHTGYVGLKNQGATCYMNSLLQVLYFTNALRKNVYKMPTEADDSAKSVALALQRVFNDLQFMDKSVGTKKLTKSFGWETLDSFMQHDVQEFLRVLLDKLEIKMKGTVVEGTIPKLFQGKMVSYIKCKNVDYTSSRTESFYDIQLNIKGKKNIQDSFKDYIKTELLEGENKYDAGSYGFQEAEKGILFESFPPVLHLHLMRFQYDPLTDCSVKFNDRFEFPEVLDLTDFINPNSPSENSMEVDKEPVVYVLHAVLVHSGDNHGGHYVVFINPKGDGKWCKFDDDVVSRCTSNEAIQYNFGGSDDDSNVRQSTNAYMLVYIRQSSLTQILCDVNDSDIPGELLDRLEKEKKLEIARRKEKSEAHLYMTIQFLTEDQFAGHQGNDLFDPETVVYQDVRVGKNLTLDEVMGLLSEQLKYPKETLRIWPINHRSNQTLRPHLIDCADKKTTPITEVAGNASPWTIYLEMSDPRTSIPLDNFDKDKDVLLFLKYYDPVKEKIHFVGRMQVSIIFKVSDMMDELLERANLPPGTPLLLYEEIKPNMIELITDVDKPLESVLEELMDGDIIIYQKKEEDSISNSYRHPYCRDYFRYLYYKVDVTFVNKNVPNDPGVVLTLSQTMDYKAFSQALGKRLDVSPDLLQFFKIHNYRDAPASSLRCTYEGTLKDLLTYSKPKSPKKVYYQLLSIPIHELENKRQFKVSWLVAESGKSEEKELYLFPSKTGAVRDLLGEARNQVEECDKLRFLEISSYKIVNIISEKSSLDSLSPPSQSKTYRIEKVPQDQIDVADNELLVPVAHFHKEIYSTFGIPFLLKIRDGSKFEEVKEKIRKHLGVSEKEFDKYRIAVVSCGRPRYVDEVNGEVPPVRIKDFLISTGSSPKPWIGLEHVNKGSKRPRYNYMEKGIKIYN